VQANITLFAQWKQDQEFTIYYNANGGSGTMSSVTVAQGQSHSVYSNTFSHSGYSFTGWNTSASGGGTTYLQGATIPNVQANITLFAQWEALLSSFTVSYEANGGSGTMSSATVTQGESHSIKPNGFIYEGYTFAGWNTAADGSGTSYEPDTYINNIQGNITLFAQWAPEGGTIIP
jgi:uncharacterized repeat protein (TIGR02543 family)